jgi:hypothetical protein
MNQLLPVIEVLNHGPGTITMEVRTMDNRPWWKRKFSRLSYTYAPTDHKPVAILGAGDIFREVLPEVWFAGVKRPPDVGFLDNWRNDYWAPRSDVWRVAKAIRQMPKWKGYGKKRIKAE